MGAAASRASLGEPEPRARHLLCLRRRPPRQSVLGDAERRLLRLAGGARDRAHPVQPRLAVAPRPAPSVRRRARQAAAPDARTRRWRSRGGDRVPAVRHARAATCRPRRCCRCCSTSSCTGTTCRRRSRRRASPPTASRPRSRRYDYYPGRLSIEGRIPEAVIAELARRGHKIQRWPDWIWTRRRGLRDPRRPQPRRPRSRRRPAPRRLRAGVVSLSLRGG